MRLDGLTSITSVKASWVKTAVIANCFLAVVVTFSLFYHLVSSPTLDADRKPPPHTTQPRTDPTQDIPNPPNQTPTHTHDDTNPTKTTTTPHAPPKDNHSKILIFLSLITPKASLN